MEGNFDILRERERERLEKSRRKTQIQVEWLASDRSIRDASIVLSGMAESLEAKVGGCSDGNLELSSHFFCFISERRSKITD